MDLRLVVLRRREVELDEAVHRLFHRSACLMLRWAGWTAARTDAAGLEADLVEARCVPAPSSRTNWARAPAARCRIEEVAERPLDAETAPKTPAALSHRRNADRRPSCGLCAPRRIPGKRAVEHEFRRTENSGRRATARASARSRCVRRRAMSESGFSSPGLVGS